MEDLLNYLEDIPEYSRDREAISRIADRGVMLLLANALSSKPMSLQKMWDLLWEEFGPQIIRESKYGYAESDQVKP